MKGILYSPARPRSHACRSASGSSRPCSSTSSRPCSPCRGTACRSCRGRRPRHCGSPYASAHGRRAAPPRNRPCRCGWALPASSTSRSSGPVTKPSGMPESGVIGLPPSLPAGLGPGGASFGKGGLKRKPPGTSTVPSSTCSRWMARQVWKPLVWAEMPRIACMAIGRPQHRLVAASGPVRPGHRQLDRLVRRRHGRVLRRSGGWSPRRRRNVPPPRRANRLHPGSARQAVGRQARSAGR